MNKFKKTPKFENKPRSSSVVSKNETEDFNELQFSINDDYKTLVKKNTKLRSLLVKASDKINEQAIKQKELENSFKVEKENILNELDKIMKNYKIYAESHKNYLSLENDFNNLKKDYLHNSKVIKSYSDSLRFIYLILVSF